MTYVPVVTPPPTSTPSPQARELADLLTRVLEEYTRAHPSTSRAEIRTALALAARRAIPGSSKQMVTLSLALGLGLAVFTGMLVFMESRGGGEWVGVLPIIVLAVIVFLAITIIAIRRRSG